MGGDELAEHGLVAVGADRNVDDQPGRVVPTSAELVRKRCSGDHGEGIAELNTGAWPCLQSGHVRAVDQLIFSVGGGAD